MNKPSKNIFWDYDLSKINLSDPRVKPWYLTRKLQMGDLTDISRADLKKFLPGLEIDASLKELLANFLKTDV